MTLVKICGVTTIPDLDTAVEAGADYVGFVHFEPSPRHVNRRMLDILLEHVGIANRRYGTQARSVVLLVEPPVHLVESIEQSAPPHAFQLHGTESPAWLEELRWEELEEAKLIKALPVQASCDVEAAAAYAEVADYLMFDAKPPAGAERPGGHGSTFDWALLAPNPQSPTPNPEALWFLAGGLTPANVAEAVRVTGAPVVDVSSGVESAPGVKDPALIRAFIQAARNAS
jgi:phosphoribosylanthranilate isomerase